MVLTQFKLERLPELEWSQNHDRPASPIDKNVDTPAAPDGASDALVGRRPVSRQRRPSRTWLIVLTTAALACITALGIRYGWPRPVDHIVAAKGAFRVELSGPGTLDATKKAAISARVQGRLTEIRVDRNDAVATGALIARIASDDLASQLTASMASREAAKRAVMESRADKARYEAALTNAKATHSRQSALIAKGWTTQANYDAALATKLQAEADLTRAEAAIEAAEAQERAAAATVKFNQALLDEAIIRAPFSGTVIARDRNLGDFVTPGASIVQLVDPSSVILTARFDESAMGAVHPGQRALLRFTSEPRRRFTGHVLRLGRQVDAETREFTVDLVPDELPVNWAVGQRGTAEITVAQAQDVISVPGSYIARRNGVAGVWVVVSGRARWRPAVLGRSGGDRVEIREGLIDGDRVLAPSNLYQGMRVALSGVG